MASCTARSHGASRATMSAGASPKAQGDACAAAGESARDRRHAGPARRARPHRREGRGGRLCALRRASVPRRSGRASAAARDRIASRGHRSHDRAAVAATRAADGTEAARCRLTVPVPDAAGVREILKAELDLYATQSGQRAKGDPAIAQLLVTHLVGLPEDDVRRLARHAIRDDGLLDRDDVGRLVRAKRELLGGAGLELALEGTTLDDVAGMPHLKAWLAERRAVFVGEAGAPPLDPPRGVLHARRAGSGQESCGEGDRRQPGACRCCAWISPRSTASGPAKPSGSSAKRSRRRSAWRPRVALDRRDREGHRDRQRRSRRRRVASRARNAAHVDGGAPCTRARRGDRERHRAPAARAASQGPLRRDLLRRSSRRIDPRSDLPVASRQARASVRPSIWRRSPAFAMASPGPRSSRRSLPRCTQRMRGASR